MKEGSFRIKWEHGSARTGGDRATAGLQSCADVVFIADRPAALNFRETHLGLVRSRRMKMARENKAQYAVFEEHGSKKKADDCLVARFHALHNMNNGEWLRDDEVASRARLEQDQIEADMRFVLASDPTDSR